MLLLIFVKDVDSTGKTLFWFPRSFSHGITGPFDKILISSSSSLMLQDTLDFSDLFSIFNVRWWPWVIFAINSVFPIWSVATR